MIYAKGLFTQSVVAADLLIEPGFEVVFVFVAFWFKLGLTAEPAGG